MNRKGIIAIAVAVPVLIVLGLVVGLLGYANELPWQSQPTAIPVTPFANVGGSAPTATTAVPAATSAPATAAPLTATGYSAAATSGTPTTSPAAVTTASTPAAASASGGKTVYTIAADKSQAKVTVNEKLVALPAPSDAVLTTNSIQGQIFLGPDGKPVEGAKIQVDLRTLKSDKTQRDNFIRNNTLQSDKFPLAEYVITGVDGWTGPLTEGQSSKFKLLGNMTIHGVTKPITFDTTATMQSGAITGTATTNFKFEDFGLTPPDIASIVKANDAIRLDMTINAPKSA